MPVTTGDRVLIHLSSRVSTEGWVGGVSDQDLISSLCGIGRTHVPRVLKPLLDQGLVTEETGRSPGKVRRVKVYSLTEKGEAAAEEAEERGRKVIVRFIDDDNRVLEDEALKILSTVNKRLTRLSMASVPLTLFLSLQTDSIKWNDILWIATSLRREEGEAPRLPAGWAPYVHEGPARAEMFPADLLCSMDDLLKENGIVLVKGSAVEELVDLFTMSRKRRTLWLERKGKGGKVLEGGPWDTLVLLGGGDPDVGSVLLGDGKVRDIRDDNWAEELRDTELILTTTADVEIKGPVVEVEGVREDYFVSVCSDMGISEELSREIFKAFKGSTDILAVLEDMSAEDVRNLVKMDREDAVLSLLMRCS